MFCFILCLTAIVVSRSQSTEESAVCQPGTQQFCKQQMEWGGQGWHSSALLCWLTLLELAGRWRGLLLSHNLAITHRCLNKSSRVHSWGMEHVIWTPDRHGWGDLRRRLFRSSGHRSLWEWNQWLNCCSQLSIKAYNPEWYSPDGAFLFSLRTSCRWHCHRPFLSSSHGDLAQSRRVVFSNTEWAREAAAESDLLSQSKTLS